MRLVNGVAKHGDEVLDSGGKIVKHSDQLVEGVGDFISRNVDETVDADILVKVSDKKNLLSSSLKKTPNAGYADVNIEGLSQSDYFAHSGIQNAEDLSYIVQNRIGNISPKAKAPEFKTQVVNKQNIVDSAEGWDRIVDTESKILEDINKKISSMNNPEGTIKLYTDLKPCPSCENVIKQFKSKYPNIAIEVIYTK